MDSSKNHKKALAVQYFLILLLAAAIAFVSYYIMERTNLNVEVSFSPDYTVAENPLMGYAPDAKNVALCEKSSLVFITLSWAQWEPKEGHFDVNSLEETNHIEKWKAAGKHAVLRFVCDIPDNETYFDIPTWLFQKTGDGTRYHTKEGDGYSPDYSNKDFLKYHKRALEKLAEYCNSDDFVAFVEMGSLGHFGQWYASDGKGNSLMPDEKTCNEYLETYSGAFRNALLLSGQSDIALSEGVDGYYQRRIGDQIYSNEWLERLSKQEEGNASEGNAPDDENRGLKGNLPIGGEFIHNPSTDKLLEGNIGQILSSVSNSGMTYIGPTVPDFVSGDHVQEAYSVLKRMGYRLYVSNLRTRYDFAKRQMEVEVKFRNAGNAGFYFDWPVTIYLFDAEKNKVYWESLTIDLRDLNEKEEVSDLVLMPVDRMLWDEFYVGVSITDYHGKNGIKLAISADEKAEFVDEVQLIYHYVRN